MGFRLPNTDFTIRVIYDYFMDPPNENLLRSNSVRVIAHMDLPEKDPYHPDWKGWVFREEKEFLGDDGERRSNILRWLGDVMLIFAKYYDEHQQKDSPVHEAEAGQ